MKSAAAADVGTDCTFTKSFQVLHINDEQYESFLPFDLCDTMGLENEPEKGVAAEDLVKVLKGHIRDGYKFNPIRPCCDQDREYNSSPTLADRIHCMVCVIPANHISMMEDDVIRKLRNVRAKAADMRIPQVVVLTNIDKACPEVANDIKLVYQSKIIKKKMEVCSNRLGVPMNCIFPVKNYHEEINLKNDIDVLLLSAMNFILHFANDHLAVAAKAGGDTGLARDLSSMNFSNDDTGHGDNISKPQSGFYPTIPRS
ncbi:interferon-induced protein 44-like [Engraulis encrasicolus]|uniref:interferon-induced protein 44-like n=1 Tax=Engraulis encrasicolus TaxID=184585 RepID=UPI002FD38E4B